MAGRKKAAVSKQGGVVVVQTPAAAPARRRKSGGAVAKKHTKRRRSSSGGNSEAGMKTAMTGAAIGGFAVGFIEKNWGDQIPHLPIVGRKGAIALGAYFLRGKSKWVRDIGVAAAGIAGYEYGKLGTVSGVGSVTAQL